ncbi:MAG: phosphate ABC transporter substrate-binding protein [Methanothrix sp.]|uniref:phosphate ABC transporter substrate-binding protein n=1 Tax=Methanothrix sp. TaxID=90426 RepID=UPI00247BC910|nr:phosphate ABC transporter substrate-binding protein [Methanothrix sp.]
MATSKTLPLIPFLMLLLVLLFVPSNGVERVRVSGSTTVMPLAELCAEEFNFMCREYMVTVTAGGSGVGIIDAAEGRADIAMCSREIKPSEKALYERADRKFREVLVGYDAIVIVVSPQIYDSGVRSLTAAEVRMIYSGEMRNWKSVGGPDREIMVVGRKAGSGTRDTFNEIIMGSAAAETPGVSIEAMDSSEVKTAIIGSDRAIGYLGYSYVKTGGVMPIALNGVYPTMDNIRSGNYTLARKLYFYTFGEPTAGARAFIDFVLGPQGRRIAEMNGFIPP